MTEQIKSAIEHLDNLIGMVEDNQNNDYDSDFKLAICSLKAWEEVLNELEAEKNKSYENWGFNYLGLKRAINIINQKLVEIDKAGRMTHDRAIELLKIERECINRNNQPFGKNCDRNCSKCDLVQNTEELLEMYDYVIDAIEKEGAECEIIEKRRLRD